MKLSKMKFNSQCVIIALFAISILFIGCQQKQIEPTEKILIKIADKSISVDEFIRRAEYTIRPPYCKGSHNLDKKIIINSLIAEKLMAIEAGDTNKFITNDKIEAHLRGLKEQSMRRWLYKCEVLDKVVIDTAKQKQIFKLAGRKYQIAHFSLPDSNSASLVKQELVTNQNSFEPISNEITGRDSLLRREVEWSAGENDMVLDSLFSRPLRKNQIVGPIKIDDKQYMFIKVKGSTISPAITELQAQERWENIGDELTQREAVKQYDTFVYQVMKDKKLEFMGDTFFKISDLLEPIYNITEEEKNKRLKNLFGEKSDNELETYRDLQSRMEELYQKPLFEIDNDIWTVKDFTDELITHPLVFRTKKLNKKNFHQQLKFAIVDMVRDHYLTKVAYKRGYDKINVVKRNENMWRDNLNYQYYRSELLRKAVPDSASELTYFQIINNYLNAPVDSLQKKYSDVIELDVDVFNNIKLTRIDMQAYYQNVPFPQVVPSFPLVTTDNRLDYGKKMKTGIQ